MSAQDVIEIQNKLYQYCWLIDSGDFDGVAELLKYADVSYDGKLAYSKNPEAYLKTTRGIITYEDKTPKTMHMCINPQIEVDEANGTAKARSYTVVIQGHSGEFLPKFVWMDRKIDTLAKIDGKWEFTSRDFVTHAMGDTSTHLKNFKAK